MVVITKYLDIQSRYQLKVEDNGVVMFDMQFECEKDLNTVADELYWMFSVRFNKQVQVINEL